ncbi:prolipoprotein diacylglyceryl transferase [Periweissella ghanensis]|uniref:Phosphatidylglycerol--prolipoprotein diacylglyceryl transferase n=1 Tax=Periweissella ghanensis TaxID=467997 RepID=A0ABN8BNU9_9LACO|nr:prolipoprotein diacylglyceryl transferase [Periweissella ghanensis]MCM0600505.1 prolipoprotein diacylglyceryl transferase [Periweissella ghanensis]CAH0418285.1 Phosphatidylglycerol--prolipoprotein diacylglyceryl transferase [Periweissella ghanensis]
MIDLITALNPIAFKIGGWPVHWYGVIIASAVVLAVTLSVREAKRRHLISDDIYDVILIGMPVALVTARIYYVIFEWPYYSQHPALIPAIWDGGIAIYGGLIGGLLVVLFVTRHKLINTWLYLDIIAPTVILAQGIGRWGNFMNQEAYGRIVSHSFLTNLHIPTFIVNQMFIGGHYRMPTYLWESLWDVTGFIVIMLLRHRPHLFKQGEVVLTYIIWYSFGRFWIEGMRTDSLYWGPFRVSQVLSLILFFGAIVLWYVRRKRKPENRWYLDGHSLTQNM